MTDIHSPEIRDTAIEAALRLVEETPDAHHSVTIGDAFAAAYPEKDMTRVSERTFRSFLRDVWIPEAVEDALDFLRKVVDEGDGRLRVWRSVRLNGDPVASLAEWTASNGVGVHWSTSRDQAHPHDGSRLEGVDHLIEAVVDADAVDWVATLATYGHPEWVGEDEIRVRPEGLVEIVSLTRRGGWLFRTAEDRQEVVDLGGLEGRLVTAGVATPDLVHVLVSRPAAPVRG